MNGKDWLATALALAVAGCLWLVSPRLGSGALILAALGAVVTLAFRVL